MLSLFQKVKAPVAATIWQIWQLPCTFWAIWRGASRHFVGSFFTQALTARSAPVSVLSIYDYLPFLTRELGLVGDQNVNFDVIKCAFLCNWEGTQPTGWVWLNLVGFCVALATSDIQQGLWCHICPVGQHGLYGIQCKEGSECYSCR